MKRKYIYIPKKGGCTGIVAPPKGGQRLTDTEVILRG